MNSLPSEALHLMGEDCIVTPFVGSGLAVSWISHRLCPWHGGLQTAELRLRRRSPLLGDFLGTAGVGILGSVGAGGQ
jgi:hypothetical protein